MVPAMKQLIYTSWCQILTSFSVIDLLEMYSWEFKIRMCVGISDRPIISPEPYQLPNNRASGDGSNV